MARNAVAQEVMAQVKEMSAAEKQKLVEQILLMMQDNEGESPARIERGECPDCPHCGGAAVDGGVYRKGYNRNGAQRFYCRSCGRIFVASTGTAFARTRKSDEVWRRFIELTLSGASIVVCKQECGIAHQTAFTWRHKVLNVFKVAQEEIRMSGWVEADEALFPLSYKGNHVKGRVGERRLKGSAPESNMPREAFKRGSDNKVKSPKARACVFCMVENSNQAFYAAVPGVGYMSNDMLDASLAKHVDSSSALVLVDKYKVTQKYLEDNSYQHITLISNTSDNVHDHKPEVRGENRDIHLQHVNAMHTHLRKFLKDYCGVSSKYLCNYVAMYTWLKNNKALGWSHNALEATNERARRCDCYITARQIKELPSVPTHILPDVA